MTEIFPSDQELNALSGVTESEQEVPFLTIGESPYHTSFYRMMHRLLTVAKRAGDLRVYKDGPLTFGLRAGKFAHDTTVRSAPAGEGNALTDNAVNYIYLLADATLVVNTTGFPDATNIPHVPLAVISTSGGEYRPEDITDFRGGALFQTLRAASSGGAAWGGIGGTLSDQADLSSALAGKQDTLPSTPSAGYLYDDGSGNRAWNAIGEGPGENNWTRQDGTLSPANTSDRVIIGDTDDDGSSLQVSGDVRFAGLISGGPFGEIICNTINASFHNSVPFIRLTMGANSENPGFINFIQVPIFGNANDVFLQAQPPTENGYVYWEAYLAAGLVVATVDDKPILFKTSRQQAPVAVIESTGLSVSGTFSATGAVTLSGLPASDPQSAGQLWNDSGTLKVSAG